MTSSDGIDFEEAYPSRQMVELDKVSIPFLGLKQLLRTKEATGRLQDLADAENLKKINNL